MLETKTEEDSRAASGGVTGRPFLKPMLDHGNRWTCMLIVTHKCNLNCRYCYESYKDSGAMPLELAKELILKEFDFVKGSSRFNEMEIDFMGGEPLMNFDLIKEVVEWLETGVSDVPWVCFVTTNATLLTDERKQWFRAHRDSICLTASYDGTTSMQEENRQTHEKPIDLDFFHELWPSQPFHMTISKQTLPHMFDGIASIMRRGWEIDVALAQGEPWTREDAVILKRELRKFKDAYLAGELHGMFHMLSRNLHSIGDVHTRETALRYCGSGENMVTYEVDGTAYGCHMFTPLVLGKERALELREMNLTDDRIEMDDCCRDCVLADYCSTCMGFNYRYRGSLGRKDMNFCLMNLAMAEVACEFQTAALARESGFSKTEAEFAKSVLSAQPVLSHFDCAVSVAPFVLDDCKNARKGGEKNEDGSAENQVDA